MRSFRDRPVGWRYESLRHSLAKRGLTAKTSKSGLVGSSHGIPIYARKLPEGMVYPLSSDELKREIDEMPKSDVEGIKRFEFDAPKGEQKESWAQYVRSKKTVKIFGQTISRDGRIDGEEPRDIRKWIKEYVIPHEVGHHKALKGGKTDRDLEMAEARADANVVGLEPFDKDVKRIYSMRQHNI